MNKRFTTAEDIINYFKELKTLKIPLDYAFEFYLPRGCDYGELREHGIGSFKDLNDDEKYEKFINSYVPENIEDIALALNNTYIFNKHKIVYKRTFTDDKGITSPILVDVVYSDRLDRVPLDAVYYFAMEKFGRPPNKGETFQEQQKRLRREMNQHKDLEGLVVIEEIEGYKV